MSDDLILEDLTVNRDKADRFWNKLTTDANGCMIWPGALNNSGYGVFRIGVRGLKFSTTPHRVAWMLRNGRVVPEGLHVDHLCRVRSCCNPDHLEPVSQRENVARSFGRSLETQASAVRRSKGSVQLRKSGRHVATWREYLSDGSVVQRGETYATHEEAEAALGVVDFQHLRASERGPNVRERPRFTLKRPS